MTTYESPEHQNLVEYLKIVSSNSPKDNTFNFYSKANDFSVERIIRITDVSKAKANSFGLKQDIYLTLALKPDCFVDDFDLTSWQIYQQQNLELNLHLSILKALRLISLSTEYLPENNSAFLGARFSLAIESDKMGTAIQKTGKFVELGELVSKFLSQPNPIIRAKPSPSGRIITMR